MARLRAQERRFEIVCTCSNFAVLAAAAAAGLGVTPMIDGLAPDGLDPSADKRLPPLPEVTLLLLARSQALALASRRWVASRCRRCFNQSDVRRSALALIVAFCYNSSRSFPLPSMAQFGVPRISRVMGCRSCEDCWTSRLPTRQASSRRAGRGGARAGASCPVYAPRFRCFAGQGDRRTFRREHASRRPDRRGGPRPKPHDDS